jgi:3',5'-nucleoside bisphosphate phosphatase
VKTLAADLHIHTALSPCASDEMTPPDIVERAIAAGLDIIAICDHNSAGNVNAVQDAAEKRLCVFAGMELATAEDIHILGIFPDTASAMAAGNAVAQTLPMTSKQYAKKFGRQLILDAAGRVKEQEERMLTASSGYSLAEAINLIKRYGGLAIAAHINRSAFSIFSQLGIFPDDAGFDAVEIFCPPLLNVDVGKYAFLELPMIVSSDSHYLADVGRCRTKFAVRSACFEELTMAIKGISGRGVESINK